MLFQLTYLVAAALAHLIAFTAMTSTFAQEFERLRHISRKLDFWEATSIPIVVATSLSNDHPRHINLSETIGLSKRCPRCRTEDNVYWLPSEYNQNNRNFRSTVINALVYQWCKAAGFRVAGSWEGYSKDGKLFRQQIRYKCVKGKFHNESKNAANIIKAREKRKLLPKVPQAATKLPTKKAKHASKSSDSEVIQFRKSRPKKPQVGMEGNDQTCPFVFCIFWDDEKERWYFPHQQSGSFCHHGHIKELPQNIRLQSRHTGNEHERTVANDAMSVHIVPAAAGCLFTRRTGEHLDQEQLRYLKSKEKNRLIISKDGCQATPADRLEAWAKADPTISSIALYGVWDSGLLKIRVKKRHLNNSLNVDDFNDDLGDATDSPRTFAESVRGDLTQTSSGEVLLIFSWTTDESRRKFDAFPEFVGGEMFIV